MRLLDTETLRLVDFIQSKDAQPYAILSHTWEEEEVTFALLNKPEVEKWKGYTKIARACERARQDGYAHIWIDTCCIDKSSSSELSEAINSMFAWYRDADVCYAFLSDVDEPPYKGVVYDLEVNTQFDAFPGDVTTSTYTQHLTVAEKVQTNEFMASRWFKRGWTLQELLAPPEVIFYSRSWAQIAERNTLAENIMITTGIDSRYLSHTLPLSAASVSERMFWAAGRQTTRPEDRAYSLLGIFDVNMPLLYGEGENAFIRLQEEIMKQSDDQTLFAWTKEVDYAVQNGLLAPDPDCFTDSSGFVPYQEFGVPVPFNMTNKGLHVRMSLVPAKLVHGDYGENLYKGLLNCTSPPDYKGFLSVYVKRLGASSDQYVRVYCDRLSTVELSEAKPPESIFIRQHDIRAMSRRLWPDSLFLLRDGPELDLTHYPVVDVVCMQFLGGSSASIPYLGHPRDRPSDPVLQEDTSKAILRQSTKRARRWIPGYAPVICQVPRASDLVAIAFEFWLTERDGVIVMLGSSSEHGVGYSCKYVSQGRRIHLRQCGKFFRPQQMNSSTRIKFGESVFEVWVKSEPQIQNTERIFLIDIHIYAVGLW